MTACSDVEAVVLVGGQGTRLRPLTLSAAKPMLPTAGVPFLAHQLSRLRAIGIRRVALGTSYRASTFSDHFGDGSALGMNIAYVVEDAPLGTGGAIRNVLDRLTAPTILVLNGDILSGVDLQALLDQHRSRQADVTLHLVRVPDARAFGCVLTDPDGRVRSFVEKSDTPATDQINAGCYVFRRDIIQTIPADTVVSVERETFPGQLGSGARVFGHVDTTYWLDLGTPAAFVQGSADLVRGLAPTSALPGPVGDSLRLEGAMVAVGSAVTGGTTLGRGVRVGADATVDGSVIFDGARIGDGARVIRSAVGHHAVIGRNVVLIDAVIGDGAVIGDNCELPAAARVWPGVTVPAGSTQTPVAL